MSTNKENTFAKDSSYSISTECVNSTSFESYVSNSSIASIKGTYLAKYSYESNSSCTKANIGSAMIDVWKIGSCVNAVFLAYLDNLFFVSQYYYYLYFKLVLNSDGTISTRFYNDNSCLALNSSQLNSFVSINSIGSCFFVQPRLQYM